MTMLASYNTIQKSICLSAMVSSANLHQSDSSLACSLPSPLHSVVSPVSCLVQQVVAACLVQSAEVSYGLGHDRWLREVLQAQAGCPCIAKQL
mmetsp:Transcript_6911/g.12982  ORF Transcript_6911/g.12982 Transcript_6911/m.12982 type:complete len:93 (-) Transcript_6911:459-737(-)